MLVFTSRSVKRRATTITEWSLKRKEVFRNLLEKVEEQKKSEPSRGVVIAVAGAKLIPELLA